MPTSEETLVRLAVIEQKLETNSQNWMNPVRRIEEAVGRVEKQLIGNIQEIKDEAKTTKNEVDALKNQFQAWKIRISTGITIVAVFWLVFGSSVERFVERIFI